MVATGGGSSSYDVFFSYHWRDRSAVETVARALTDRGFRVFLDRWYLAAGQPWPRALEQALASCRAVAVFLGPEGMGSWQQREQHLALDRQAREQRFPVIPVLLPGGDPPLGFLTLNTWVDLRSGVSTDDGLGLLVAAVQGNRRAQRRGFASSRRWRRSARTGVCSRSARRMPNDPVH